MSNPSPAATPVVPRHLWVVGVLSLLWNSVGAFDYLMTQTRNASYLSAFTPEQLAYFQAFPSWVVATWALSVWGGVLGSILLLLRRRLALTVFGVSLVTMLPTFFYNYVLTDGLRIMAGAGWLSFNLVIVVVGWALLFYVSTLSRRCVLR